MTGERRPGHRMPYTAGEEIANVATHAAGIGLSIVGLVVLVTNAARFGNAYHVISVSIFGGTLIMLYVMSTLYHSFTHPGAKHVLRVLDHISIYLLIAGSYAPFTLVVLRGGWGWTLLTVTWSLAVLGIIFKVFFTEKRFRAITVLFYLALGWVVIIAIKPVIENLPTGGLLWLILGGFFYTSGIAFYLWHKLPYHHAIWHLFVLLGSLSHFFAVYFYVIPSSPQA